MKEHKHIGVYALLIKNDQILLIKKVTGPYDGKLDLPGGTIEFGETPEETLKRELLEETGIEVIEYQLYDANSVVVSWKHQDNIDVKTHHIGFFYKILDYKNEIKKEILIDQINDDSLGAEFSSINKLNKEELSAIAILELDKLGYNLK